jgi:hypothetical protein
VLFILFGLNTTRVLRVLRLRRIINSNCSSIVEKLQWLLILYIIMMILFFSAVMQYLEYPKQQFAFHTWMYYILVTIATVGYGDVSPVTATGRIAAMLIILYAMVLIPMLVNRLLEKMSLQSTHARAKYKPPTATGRHVLICGSIASTNMAELFAELFHQDHYFVGLHVVMLLPHEPPASLVSLMEVRHDLKYNTTYLMGSLLKTSDLQRACVERAGAVFLLNDKFTADEDKEDTRTIIQYFSIRRYMMNHEVLAGVTKQKLSGGILKQTHYLQLMRPENASHMANAYSERHIKSVIISLNEIKMGILAKSLINPGANALIMNLLNSHSIADLPNEIPTWLR